MQQHPVLTKQAKIHIEWNLFKKKMFPYNIYDIKLNQNACVGK